jgi:hypothetical protein
MTHVASNEHTVATRAFMLLPVALATHIAEEWFAGFTDWARVTINIDIDAAQFLTVNLIGLVLFTIVSAIAYLDARSAWIGVSLTALFCVNAALHAGLSIATGAYSPGTISGLLLYVPLSVIIFRWAAMNMSRSAVAGAILFGVAVHAVVTLSVAL